jgi:hypothetical protein
VRGLVSDDPDVVEESVIAEDKPALAHVDEVLEPPSPGVAASGPPEGEEPEPEPEPEPIEPLSRKHIAHLDIPEVGESSATTSEDEFVPARLPHFR